GRVLAAYAGLLATLFLSTLDQTAVVTALPRIVGDLGGLDGYAWVVTAYLLAMTVTVPLYGKLVDAHGPRPLFAGALALFLAGSALCAAAHAMWELTLARGVQGLGAGGLVPLSLTTVGTLVPPRERGRYVGLSGAVLAAAAVGGPSLGGALADGPGWRWLFLLNLPAGAVALAIVLAALPSEPRRASVAVDYAGATLAGAAAGGLLLALVWGGYDYAWTSPEVAGALAAAAVALAALWLVERRAADPILPLELLRLRVVGASVAALTLVGVAMLGTVVFVPLLVQGVVGESAARSGLVVMPFMLAAVAASVASGQWVTRTGRYKGVSLLGLAILTAGLGLVWRLDVSTSAGEVARDAAIAGAGLGLAMQVLVVAVQNAVPVARLGTATALVHFARLLGGAVGVAAMAAIAARDLPRGLDVRGPVPAHVPAAVAARLVTALRPAFLLAGCACLAALLVVGLWLREEPLRASLDEAAPHAEPSRSLQA